MNISKDVSRSLMATNLIATILVVAIHYNSKGSIDVSLGYDLNYIIQEALTNGFARSSVPIFALLSGYFVANKVSTFNGYRLTLTNKFRTLIIPYLAGSIIILLSSSILEILFHQENNIHFELYSIAYWMLAHPSSIQFWFLRDLIVLTIISPILFNMNKQTSYGMGVLLIFLWILDIQPFPIIAGWYFLNIETLFFFYLGGVLFQRSTNIGALIFCKNTTKIIIASIWIELIALRIYIDPDLDVWYAKNYTLESILLYKMAILLGVISIPQVSIFIRNSKFIIHASGLTFFVFLFHLTPSPYLKYFTRRIIEIPHSFYLNFPLALFLVFIFAHIISKTFGQLYSLITGGRNPNKAFQRID